MKKLTATFLLFLCCICLFPIKVSASDYTYIRAVKSDVYVYRTAIELSGEKLFILEHSYYARIISTTGEFYMIEVGDSIGGFSKISGYVRKIDVDLVTSSPSVPIYPKQNLFINGSSANIKILPDTNSTNIFTVLSNQSMVYYGKFVDNSSQMWYYVNFANSVGYISANAVSPFAIAKHPTPLPTVTPPPVDKPDTTPPIVEQPEIDGMQMLLILLFSLPCVVIIVLIFSPSKSKVEQNHLPNNTSATTVKRQILPKHSQTINSNRNRPRYIDNDDLSDYDTI